MADGADVLLSWATMSETNNAGFQIQRRYQAAAFEPVDFVEGHGTTDQPQRYAYRLAGLDRVATRLG